MTYNSSNAEVTLAELNGSYFVAKEGGETLVFEVTADPWADPKRPREWLRPCSFDAFRKWESNKLVEDLAIIEKRGDWWLRNPQRREFKEIRLLPYGPTPYGVHNLWRGFAVEPRKGDWSHLRHFLKKVICRGSDSLCEWLVSWMASAVQHPADHALSALYMRGGSGGVRNILTEVMAGIWGQHFAEVRDHRHLSPPCNARLRDCMVLSVDFGAALDHPDAINRLSQLTQEPLIPVESVGGTPIRVPNHLHLIAFNDNRPLPAGLRASDFQVFEIANVGEDEQEMNALGNHLCQAGGLEALLYDLSRIEVPEWARVSCKTMEHEEARLVAAMSAIDRWWYDCLFRGAIVGMGAESVRWQGAPWPATAEPVNREALFAAFEWFGENVVGTRPRVSHQALWARLAKLNCTLVSPQGTKPGGARYWLLPPLEVARDGLNQKYSHSFRWPGTGSAAGSSSGA